MLSMCLYISILSISAICSLIIIISNGAMCRAEKTVDSMVLGREI